MASATSRLSLLFPNHSLDLDTASSNTLFWNCSRAASNLSADELLPFSNCKAISYDTRPDCSSTLSLIPHVIIRGNCKTMGAEFN